ncbi:MAG: dTDP-4-dehydrorhamnose reductase [Amoebophilaceae bacterium]|nr:dTDP-4-dehydrorhamnose reductase [Amoebophilaceae bacterium]
MILLLGSKGQLGRALAAQLATQSYSFVASDRRWIDIGNPEEVAHAIAYIKPTVIVNAAAFTHTSQAEKDKELAKKVNADGVKYICEAASKLQKKPYIIHISTNYVFNGLLDNSLGYMESDPIDPINYYGLTKAAGEENLYNHYTRYFILRTSWLFSPYGHNFVKQIVQKIKFDQQDAFVVNDQFGAPTSARALAHVIGLLIAHIMTHEATTLDGMQVYGTYHFSSQECSSYYDFAVAIRDYLLLHSCSGVKQVYPVETNLAETAVKRPKQGFLNSQKIKHFLHLQPHDFAWRADCNDIVSNMLKFTP